MITSVSGSSTFMTQIDLLYYRKYEVKLAKRQKQLRIKQKGSSNRNKARIKVAKVHEKITRCREDFLQKLSRKLVDENFRPSGRKSCS